MSSVSNQQTLKKNIKTYRFLKYIDRCKTLANWNRIKVPMVRGKRDNGVLEEGEVASPDSFHAE
jgi:hypothetical protein